ncbi:MAG: hypothetical protein VX069_08940 [Cyanobacteriota bacterium]|nr:hypothetical protein [Cyanobacteriota bacterium]MED5383617.1 hypothetical protein [Cyanobacteriota bacterium]
MAVHSNWFLLGWGVVAAASIWKFWRLTASYRSTLRSSGTPPDSARQRLERAWQRSNR